MEILWKILWWPEVYLWIGLVVAISWRVICRQKGTISEWVLAIVSWPLVLLIGLGHVWNKIKNFKI